jgi:suppressor of fused
MTAPENDSAPGWDAIDRALSPLYGEIKPRHYGTLISIRLGGPDPLDGISVYERNEPSPYWHFVSYGLTDLYGTEKKEPDTNGFGFELTLRLRRPAGEAEPPGWALGFLQNLARYVVQTGNAFDVGHYMDSRGPIALETDTKLKAVLFAKDVELGGIEAEHGKAQFLQVVGITLDELAAVQAWDAKRFTELLASRLPQLCTDLGRDSILSESTVAEKIRAATEREGSSTGLLVFSSFNWEIHRSFLRAKSVKMVLGAGQIDTLVPVLRGRLLHGRELYLHAKEGGIRLIPAGQCSFRSRGKVLELEFTREAAAELVEKLKPRAGELKLEYFPALHLVIQKTEIMDALGQRVIATIG